MRSRAVMAGAVTAVVALVLAGCSSGDAHDPLQTSPSLAAATPAQSPPAAAAPAGTVIPVPGDVTSAAVEPATGTLAVAVAKPHTLRLYATDSLDNPDAKARTITLPGAPGHITAGENQVLVPIPSRSLLLRVHLPSGTVGRTHVPGDPSDAVPFHGKVLVTSPDTQSLLVLDGNRVVKTIHGTAIHPDRVLVAGGHVVVLDRLRSALFDVDMKGGDFGAGLRAGQGAAGVVTDNFGRVLVTDARRGALLAFTPAPMTRRQLFPVPGTPYGIGYDAKRHLAWVAATATNELIAYDVARGEPVQKRRVPTVRQPDAVAVDPSSGTVVVGSGAGKGIQVVQP